VREFWYSFESSGVNVLGNERYVLVHRSYTATCHVSNEKTWNFGRASAGTLVHQAEKLGLSSNHASFRDTCLLNCDTLAWAYAGAVVVESSSVSIVEFVQLYLTPRNDLLRHTTLLMPYSTAKARLVSVSTCIVIWSKCLLQRLPRWCLCPAHQPRIRPRSRSEPSTRARTVSRTPDRPLCMHR
jgi:hypothetical protein